MFGALKDPELATVGAAPRQPKTLLAISHRLLPHTKHEATQARHWPTDQNWPARYPENDSSLYLRTFGGEAGATDSRVIAGAIACSAF